MVEYLAHSIVHDVVLRSKYFLVQKGEIELYDGRYSGLDMGLVNMGLCAQYFGQDLWIGLARHRNPSRGFWYLMQLMQGTSKSLATRAIARDHSLVDIKEY
jgi:hypothetical protein